MHEIKKEDWDRILDEKNAHFEEDFRTLMKRYIKNTEIAIQKEKFWSRFREQINLKNTEKVLLKENWIAEIEVPGSTWMDTDTLILEKYIRACDLLEIIGMADDFLKFYGDGEEQKDQFLDLYARMLKVQNTRIPQNKLGMALGKAADKLAEKIIKK